MAEDFRGVLIVGAGIVGAYAALSFAQRGYSVRIVEARKDFLKSSGNETLTRSINLAFSYRGREAFKAVGLAQAVDRILVPMRGRAIHLSASGTDLRADQIQPYDETDPSNHNNSVSRTELNLLLLEEVGKLSNVKIDYETKLLRVNKDMTVTLSCREKKEVLRPVLLLGCDGAHSATRLSILRMNHARYEQFYIPHAYKEFSIEATESGESKLEEREYLHIWPKGDYMMIALPNLDKSYTCTLFAPLESLSLESESEIESYFKENFPQFLSLVPDIVSQYKNNPSSRLISVFVDDWKFISEDNTRACVLLGDAAHACVPFYGIGMNCGLEDVLELCIGVDNLYEKKGLVGEDLLVSAVTAFNERRVADGHCCSRLSYDNYKEMSHHTMSRSFLMRKKIEGALNYLLGSRFIPLYKMVSFTRIPFSKVVERNRKQQSLLDGAFALLTAALVLPIGAYLAPFLLKRV